MESRIRHDIEVATGCDSWLRSPVRTVMRSALKSSLAEPTIAAASSDSEPQPGAWFDDYWFLKRGMQRDARSNRATLRRRLLADSWLD